MLLLFVRYDLFDCNVFSTKDWYGDTYNFILGICGWEQIEPVIDGYELVW